MSDFFSRLLVVLVLVLACSALRVSDLAAQGDEQPPAFFTHEDLIRTVNESKARVIVINYWATYCGPCLKEIPHLEKLRQTYSDEDLFLFAVSFDYDPAAFQKYVQKHPFSYPVYLGGMDLMSILGVEAIPLTTIYDRYGSAVVKHKEGGVTFEELTGIIDAILEQTPDQEK